MVEGIFKEDEREDGSVDREDDKVVVLNVKQVGKEFINNLLSAMRADTFERQEKYVELCAEGIESLVLATGSIIIDALTDPEPREFKVFMKVETSGETETPVVWQTFVARSTNEAMELGKEYCKKNSTMSRRYSVVEVQELGE